MSTCPVCGGDLHTASWFDEEGVEAWVCGTCGFGQIGDWSEPPDFSNADLDERIGFPGHYTLRELREQWEASNQDTSPHVD
jgi:hypothetical protein